MSPCLRSVVISAAARRRWDHRRRRSLPPPSLTRWRSSRPHLSAGPDWPCVVGEPIPCCFPPGAALGGDVSPRGRVNCFHHADKGADENEQSRADRNERDHVIPPR